MKLRFQMKYSINQTALTNPFFQKYIKIFGLPTLIAFVTCFLNQEPSLWRLKNDPIFVCYLSLGFY